MQAIDHSSQDPNAVTSVVQEYTKELVTAASPGATPTATADYGPTAKRGEFAARCQAFGEAIAGAADAGSVWAAFDKLSGK
jgi:hypothetical protein